MDLGGTLEVELIGLDDWLRSLVEGNSKGERRAQRDCQIVAKASGMSRWQHQRHLRAEDHQFRFWWVTFKICFEKSQWRSLFGSWICGSEDLHSTYRIGSGRHVDNKWSCKMCWGWGLSSKKRQDTCTFEHCSVSENSYNDPSLWASSGGRQLVTLAISMGGETAKVGKEKK